MKKVVAQKISKDDLKHGGISINQYLMENNIGNNKCDVTVSFNITYDLDNFYLYFFVQESYVKATHKKINSPVYEDSCVEFFISFDGTNYYNLEFNCIGTVLGQYGANKHDRIYLEENILNNIVMSPSLGKNKIDIIDRKTEWSINITIPKKTFNCNEIDWHNFRTGRCNFCKCGDKLKYPHFLSWMPIKAEVPDFHVPEQFGVIELGTENSIFIF